MAAHQLDSVLRRLRGLTAARGGDAPTDRELLTRFAGRHDESAFAALVARHGPMVLGVCRRVLADPHAAEDAFQATFLVLARRAGSVRRPELLGNWLHGVALRGASRARVEAAKRRAREARASARPSPDPLAEITARELVGCSTGNCTGFQTLAGPPSSPVTWRTGPGMRRRPLGGRWRPEAAAGAAGRC